MLTNLYKRAVAQKFDNLPWIGDIMHGALFSRGTMLKYFKSAPICLLFIYAMMCYGYYGVHVVFRMLNCVAGGKMVVGIVTALLLGFSAAFLVAAYRVFFKESRYLLGASLVYAGAFACCWVYRFGGLRLLYWLFADNAAQRTRYTLNLSVYSDYFALLFTSMGLLALHFAVLGVKKLRNR